MTLEETIKHLRDEETTFRRYAAIARANVFADKASEKANTDVADGLRRQADWLEELKYYKDLEEQGRLLVLPCKVGDTVYEILEETVPNHYFYINEWKVQDVSVKAVKYADEWEPYDYENLYFTIEEAEAALKKRGNNKNA